MDSEEVVDGAEEVFEEVDGAEGEEVDGAEGEEVDGTVASEPPQKRFRCLKKEDKDASRYGFLRYMATHSRGSVGSLLASSYSERVNSAANLILTKGNSLLAEEEINMCTVLRMMLARHNCIKTNPKFNFFLFWEQNCFRSKLLCCFLPLGECG
jgi:hypothetical protein